MLLVVSMFSHDFSIFSDIVNVSEKQKFVSVVVLVVVGVAVAVAVALDRLNIPRKEGGRVLISIEDCVELAIRGLEVYGHRSEERLIQAARGDKIDGLEAASGLKRSKKEKRLEDWEEKVLYGQKLRQTKELRSDQCWAWLQNGDLKKGKKGI